MVFWPSEKYDKNREIQLAPGFVIFCRKLVPSFQMNVIEFVPLSAVMVNDWVT